MAQVDVKVLRRQDAGDRVYEIGEKRRLDKGDADRLAATGAVEIIAAKAPAKRQRTGAKGGK